MLRPDLQEHDAEGHQRHPDDLDDRQPLLEHHPTHDRDQHDADAGPDRVGDAERHAPAERQAQHPEGEHVPDADDGVRPPLCLLAGGELEERGGDDFTDDGDGEEQITHAAIVAGTEQSLTGVGS